MTYQDIILLLIFLFPLAYSPGPGNMTMAAAGARFGFEATLPALVGYHGATILLTILVGLGVAASLDQGSFAFAAVQISGSLYVLWLAWKIFRAGRLENRQAARPLTMFDGAVLLFVNPKGYVIIALLFSQFTPTNVMQTLLISVVFTLNNLISFLIWAAAGDRLALLFRDETKSHVLNTCFAAALAIVAIWMLLR